MATRLQPSGTEQAGRPTTLADYVSILRRRKWIIIALPLVAGLVAYAIAESGATS